MGENVLVLCTEIDLLVADIRRRALDFSLRSISKKTRSTYAIRRLLRANCPLTTLQVNRPFTANLIINELPREEINTLRYLTLFAVCYVRRGHSVSFGFAGSTLAPTRKQKPSCACFGAFSFMRHIHAACECGDSCRQTHDALPHHVRTLLTLKCQSTMVRKIRVSVLSSNSRKQRMLKCRNRRGVM